MLAPAIPIDEETRLATLRGLNILDTPPEERFDRLTRLAQRILDAPIALISLVDSDRQWFKSHQGLDAAETSRSISFCGHAILGDEVFVVPDAALDTRFADNPLVTGAPHIRFYAGQPLKANNGSRLGTLCILDIKPRQPSQADLDVLRDLAALVENELNLLDTVETQDSLLRQSAERFQTLIIATAKIVWTTNAQGEVVDMPSWRKFTGQSTEEIKGWGWLSALHPEDVERTAAIWQQAVATRSLYATEYRVRRHDGVYLHFDVRGVPVLEQDGSIREWVGACTDITERKLSENLEHLRIRTFELLTNDAPLPDILEEIVLWVESQNTKTKCSIMLLDDQSKRLFIGAAPNLPDCYKTAIQGILIGDENCTCSMVAHSGVRVVFENILTPCRTPNCALASQNGIASCWSEPIKSSLGKMQGVFAVYHTDATSPGQDEIKLLELAANLAGVAIERKKAEEVLLRTKQESEQAHAELGSYMAAIGQNALISVADLAGRIIEVNDRFCEVSGYSRSELLGQNHNIINSGAHPSAFFSELWATISRGDIWRGDICNRSKNGALYWVDSAIVPVKDSHGQITRYISVRLEITERKKTEEELNLAAMVYQNSSEAMMIADSEVAIVSVNPAFTKVTGYTLEEVVGRNPHMLSSDRHDHDFYQAMWNEINTTGHWHGEIWNRRKNGEIYLEEITINTIYNDDGSAHRYVSLFSDITEQKKSEEMIWQQANFDTLTGLPNRRMFHDRLEQEIKKSHRSGLPMALMLLDLDRFKEVNDTLGHTQGDVLLVEAARRIAECVRESDTVARLGGDEFIVILSELEDVNSVERIAQKIIECLAVPFQLLQETVYVSASMGITLYPDDAQDVDVLIKNADQAMYVAKNSGRGRFNYFTAALQKAAQTRMRLLNDLRNALASKQLVVYYQPIVEMASGKIYKAEALLRWQHPERGMVSPAQFIPLAEESGLIHEMGDWVFHEATRELKRWRERFVPEFQISVNVSPVQFRQNEADHASSWISHLRAMDLPGQSLTIEITEGLLLNAEINVTEKLRSFREAGIQVALDDFGTGYSSLSYLKKFDIDYIKIDQSFVRNLVDDPDDKALCEAIVVMAHKLGLKVVAEGVETELQLDLLAAYGCDYAQGWLYSKAVPAGEFEAFLVTQLIQNRASAKATNLARFKK